jgi:NADPH:quinone reductase-like Zn-dependent oxidoreductase
MRRMPCRRDVWRIDRAGSLDRLTRRTEDLPDPSPGQARVAVKAVGLNFADIFACLGLYSATPPGSFIPGLEFAGVIDAVAPTARSDSASDPERDALRVGAPVVGVTRFGGYATAVNADLRYLRPMRTGWSFAEAAALPVQGLTAWYGLMRLGDAQPGDTVLLQSAAGGVGLQALAILQAVGTRIVAMVGRPSKRQWLIEHRDMAPDQAIVRDRRTFGADLDRALGALGATGFDLVFDAVAGPFFQPAYDRLRTEGRLVVYGAADFMTPGARVSYPGLAFRYLRRPRIDPLRLVSDNRSVMGFNLIWLWDRVERLAEGFAALDAMTTAPPIVGRGFAFADAKAAMRHLQSGESIGKVVLEVA